MKRSLYRLGQYRITEFETGLLWWETHFDFGRQRAGGCFIYGNILIIDGWSEEKDGLLIGEFLDRLKKLPRWEKTLYYCFTSELIEVKTGRRLPADFLKQMSISAKNSVKGKKVESEEYKDPQQGEYRIDRYRITVGDDRSISWETPRGTDRIVGGKALVESGILFLGPAFGAELKQNKQEFLYRLSRLPQWSNTLIWCRHSALRLCLMKEQTQFPEKIPSPPEEPRHSVLREHFSAVTQDTPKGDSPKQNSIDIAPLKSIPSFSSWSNKIRWPKWSWPRPWRKVPIGFHGLKKTIMNVIMSIIPGGMALIKFYYFSWFSHCSFPSFLWPGLRKGISFWKKAVFITREGLIRTP
jgi:hypothetical protein